MTTNENESSSADLKDVLSILIKDFPVRFMVEKEGLEVTLFIESLELVLNKNGTWRIKK